MKRVGVISDTHGSLDARAYCAMADCDVIVHAGDICSPDVLSELETLAPVHAVLGNNDFPEYGNDVGRFSRPVIEGVQFLVAHKPGDVEIHPLGSAALAPGDPIPKVRIHGHTHVPRLLYGSEASPSTLLMNPGAVYRTRGGFPRSVGKIEVEDGKVLRAWVESLDGDVIFSYEPASA